jgi:ectoine hydroxylase
MKQIDNYPTRINETSSFIERKDPVAHKKSQHILQVHYDKYVENGYVLIKGFFKPELVQKCLIESNGDVGLNTLEPNNNGVKRAVSGFHNKFPFKDLIEKDELIDIVKNILGSSIYIHQSRINFKKSIDGSGWHWHSDFETWHAQDGMPNMRCLTAMIPLTENNNCNGSLMLIPKSHKYFWSSSKSKEEISPEENYADQKEGIPHKDAIKYFFNKSENKTEMIVCEPTDLVLFDCNTIHVSTQNLSPIDRTNMFIVYNSIENKLVEPFSSKNIRPEELGSRKIEKIY